MWSSFVAILQKEFKHIFRDRGTLVMFFMLPVIQLSLFGFLDQNVKNLPTVIVDQDQTRYSRELIDELRATKTFEITAVTNSPDQGRAMIARGTARVRRFEPMVDGVADHVRQRVGQALDNRAIDLRAISLGFEVHGFACRHLHLAHEARHALKHGFHRLRTDGHHVILQIARQTLEIFQR